MKETKEKNSYSMNRYLWEEKYWLGASLGAVFFFFLFAIFSHLKMNIALYLSSLYVFIQCVLFLHKYYQKQKKWKQLKEAEDYLNVIEEVLPESSTMIEEMYHNLINDLRKEKNLLLEEQKKSIKEASDYETLWAHQIKVPIAAIRLLLQTEECSYKEELAGKIFDIESYVEMMLCYQRLGSLHEDLAIHSYELEAIVRNAVHKYARMFIRKKIHLEFQEFHCQVITDEKWLQFVIEQVLSNALKYTEEGSVKISCDCDKKVLMICDTGIGIAPQDISRIFDRGFTGENGRDERTSTGLGLYLCNRIIKDLSHELHVDSVKGKGTKVLIQLDHITIL